MKYVIKITTILVMMFLLAQLIGIFVANAYLPKTVVDPETGNETEVYNIPYGMEPPKDVDPKTSVISIIIALAIAIGIMLLLMKIKAEVFLRLWFLVVVILGIALALNAFIMKIPNAPLIALIVAIPLGVLKIFHRNLIVHNATELLIYPGIASVFIPLLSVWTAVLLLILISMYDIYAVWHAGFMQKMAKYQIEKVRIFAGFFVPYLGQKERARLKKLKQIKSKSRSKKFKDKKMGVNVAILGGGDVVFPMLLAGVVLATLGLAQAIIIAIGATVALSYLFYISEKGKFYPAMPFITAGCLVALGIAFLV